MRVFLTEAAVNPALNFTPEAAFPGLKTFLFVLIAVLLVIFAAIGYLTSTTHTRKLSYVEKTVFELLWVAAPVTAMAAFAFTQSYRLTGAVLIIGLIAVAVAFLYRKRPRPGSTAQRESRRTRPPR